MVAVRKHLAALVSKTGSVTTEVGALPTPSAILLNHQTRGTHHDNYSSIRAEVVASKAAKADTAETSNRKQEEATASANSAKPEALNDLLPGRQSCGISSAVENVIPGSGWCLERSRR